MGVDDQEGFDTMMASAQLACRWPGQLEGVEIERCVQMNVQRVGDEMVFGFRGDARRVQRVETQVVASFVGGDDHSGMHTFEAIWSESQPLRWYVREHRVDVDSHRPLQRRSERNRPPMPPIHKATPEKVDVPAAVAVFEQAAAELEAE
jgi:hypothetical protein